MEQQVSYLVYNFNIKITTNKLLFINYIKQFFLNHKYIEKFYWNFFLYFQYFLWLFLFMLIHFSLLFHNYSLLLLGKNKHSFTKELLIKKFIFYFLLFAFSFIIGISRLYIIWLLMLIMETYKIYNFYYIPTLREDFIAKTLIGKFIMIYKYSKEYLFFCYYDKISFGTKKISYLTTKTNINLKPI